MANLIINVAALGASLAFLIIRAKAYMKYLKPDPQSEDPSSNDPQTFVSIVA